MSIATKTKLPTTTQELIQLGISTFPATWEEYLDLLEVAEYNIEFDNNTIHTMSIASDPHETIVKNILVALSIALDDDPEIHIRSSNRHIYIPTLQKDYAPDAHVIKGKPKMHALRKGLTANTNPWLVVEVLSRSTAAKDLHKKLPSYKTIPSLKHILYIEQDYPFVSVYHRKGNSVVWENIDYDNLKDAISIQDKKISLEQLYKKVVFPTS